MLKNVLLLILSFFILIFNVVSASASIEIICSDRIGNGPTLTKEYFPNTIKLTNDFIYSSTNKNMESKHKWKVIDANEGKYDRGMINIYTNRSYTTFRYTFGYRGENDRTPQTLTASVQDDSGLKTLIYSNCKGQKENSNITVNLRRKTESTNKDAKSTKENVKSINGNAKEWSNCKLIDRDVLCYKPTNWGNTGQANNNFKSWFPNSFNFTDKDVNFFSKKVKYYSANRGKYAAVLTFSTNGTPARIHIDTNNTLKFKLSWSGNYSGATGWINIECNEHVKPTKEVKSIVDKFNAKYKLNKKEFGLLGTWNGKLKCSNKVYDFSAFVEGKKAQIYTAGMNYRGELRFNNDKNTAKFFGASDDGKGVTEVISISDDFKAIKGKMSSGCKFNAKSQRVVVYGKNNKSQKTARNEKMLCDNEVSDVVLNSTIFKTMQRNLKTLGYYKAEIDGMFGKGSCKALREYLVKETKGSYKTFTLSKFNQLNDDAKRFTQLAKKDNSKKEDASVCDKATILQNGIRRWNLDNPKAIKQVKSRGLDCGITVVNTPFTQKEAKYFLSQLMAFVSENPSEFGLNFATEFNKVRDITSGKWNSNLSKTFELFRGYIDEFPLFQKYLEDIRLAEAEANQVRLEQLRETAVQDMIVLREWAQKNVLDEKAAQIASLDAKFGDKDIQTINGLEQLIAETKRLFSATGIEDTVAQKQTNEIVNSLYNPSSIYLFANVSGDASNIYKNLDGEFSFEQAEGTYCASNKLDAFDYYVLQGKIFTTFNGLSKLTSRCSVSADVFVVKGNEITSDTVFNVINLDKLQQVLEVPKSERDTAFNQLNFLKDTIKKDVIAGDRIGYGLLKTDSQDSSICAVIDGSEQGHVDQLQQSASLLKALSYPWNGFNKITNNAEEAFKSLQRGQCSSVYGSALTLGRLYLAGESAGINMEFMPIWVSKSAVEASQKSYDATLADSANANAKLEQSIKDKEKLDKQAQQSKAELASVRQLDLREKNGLRFMVLRDELQAQVFSAVKFAFENPADEAGYIKEYLSQSFVDQSTRYSPYDGIISEILK